ncbi:MAG: TraB/GumN family protein [Bdellovibrionales bacterium]
MSLTLKTLIVLLASPTLFQTSYASTNCSSLLGRPLTNVKSFLQLNNLPRRIKKPVAWAIADKKGVPLGTILGTIHVGPMYEHLPKSIQSRFNRSGRMIVETIPVEALNNTSTKDIAKIVHHLIEPFRIVFAGETIADNRYNYLPKELRKEIPNGDQRYPNSQDRLTLDDSTFILRKYGQTFFSYLEAKDTERINLDALELLKRKAPFATQDGFPLKMYFNNTRSYFLKFVRMFSPFGISQTISELATLELIARLDYITINTSSKEPIEIQGDSGTVTSYPGWAIEMDSSFLWLNQKHNYERRRMPGHTQRDVIELEPIRRKLTELVPLIFTREFLAESLDRNGNFFTNFQRDMSRDIELYMAGNIKPFNDRFKKWRTGTAAQQNWVRETLVTRNQSWLSEIATALENSKNDSKETFIAVGFFHLIGEYGLIELLKSKGYRVKRIKE